MFKEYTERLFKSATIYGTCLVLVCSLINCVSCAHGQSVEPANNETDTDSISKPCYPDSVRYICRCSDSTLLNPCLE